MMTRQQLFKPEYSEEEVKALTKWFEERMDRLPKTLCIDKATTSENLPKTVKSYLNLMKNITLNVSHSGYVAHLLLIRERLIEEGLE